MSLVEQPVVVEEALALITKAKTIVDADMGVRVRRSFDYSYKCSCNGNRRGGLQQYYTVVGSLSLSLSLSMCVMLIAARTALLYCTADVEY